MAANALSATRQYSGREASDGFAGRPDEPNQAASWRLRFAEIEAFRGASSVRNGSAMMRPAHGTCTSSMAESQRRPLALTKCPLDERTGRDKCRAR